MAAKKLKWRDHLCGFCDCEKCMKALRDLDEYIVPPLGAIVKGYLMHPLIIRRYAMQILDSWMVQIQSHTDLPLKLIHSSIRDAVSVQGKICLIPFTWRNKRGVVQVAREPTSPPNKVGIFTETVMDAAEVGADLYAIWGMKCDFSVLHSKSDTFNDCLSAIMKGASDIITLDGFTRRCGFTEKEIEYINDSNPPSRVEKGSYCYKHKNVNEVYIHLQYAGERNYRCYHFIKCEDGKICAYQE